MVDRRVGSDLHGIYLVIGCQIAFIIDLPDLGGSEKLINKGYKIFNLTEFEGD